MTNLPIKVLSRDEVEISGIVWNRKTISNDQKELLINPSSTDIVTELGWREILRLMDEFEEPAPKWEPGMWAKYRHLAPFRIIEVGKSGLRGKFGWYPKCDCVSVPPPKEEKPAQEIAASVSYQGYGESTGANREGPSYQPLRDDQRMALGLKKEQKPSQELRCLVTGNMCGSDTWAVGHECPCDSCRRWLLAHRAVETSEKPENPFKGLHWTEGIDRMNRDAAYFRDCDLADELKAIRQLLADKSETP